MTIELYQIDSFLFAIHNIAFALGAVARALSWVAVVLVIYPWLGGFGSQENRGSR